jgi:glutamine amidotransferase
LGRLRDQDVTNRPIGIVACGLGNIASIQRMFEAVDCDADIITNPSDIDRCGKLVLPGVGAFDEGMRLLDEGGWIEPLNRAAIERRVPILGICLGMQLLCRGSEEGDLPGLGWIDADVRILDTGGNRQLKLPHMGWSDTEPARDSDLLSRDGEEKRFYYVHKYRVICEREEDVLATANYGETFVSAIQRGNIHGVQFHPEKSHRFGKDLLGRFGQLPC